MSICASDIPFLSDAGSAHAPAAAHAEQPKSAAPDERRVDISPDEVRKGLGRLVLVLVRLIHDLLERQAIRRMDAGDLAEDDLDRLGTTLMLQAREIERMRIEFGLEPSDLNLDLGPVGRLL